MDWKLGGVILALLAQPVFAQNITERHDRFTGQTKLDYTNPGKVEMGHPTVSIFARIGGETAINGIKFMVAPPLVGRFGRQEMPYVGCRKIEWIADGRPLELGMVIYDYLRVDYGRIDMLTQEASTEALAAMGAASSVEYRLCGVTEGSFDGTDIAAARAIAARLQGAPAPEPATEQPAMKYRPKF